MQQNLRHRILYERVLVRTLRLQMLYLVFQQLPFAAIPQKKAPPCVYKRDRQMCGEKILELHHIMGISRPLSVSRLACTRQFSPLKDPMRKM